MQLRFAYFSDFLDSSEGAGCLWLKRENLVFRDLGDFCRVAFISWADDVIKVVWARFRLFIGDREVGAEQQTFSVVV